MTKLIRDKAVRRRKQGDPDPIMAMPKRKGGPKLNNSRN